MKNQHLNGAEQAAAPGVVHIDLAAASRDEEAAFGDHSRKTRICRTGTFFGLFQATLQTIFTPFFVAQFHALRSQFLVFCGSFRCLLVCLGAPCWDESS